MTAAAVAAVPVAVVPLAVLAAAAAVAVAASRLASVVAGVSVSVRNLAGEGAWCCNFLQSCRMRGFLRSILLTNDPWRYATSSEADGLP